MRLHRYESVHALLFFVLLSIVLMAGHFYSENVRQITRVLSVLSAPVHLIAASPSTLYRWFEGSLDSEEELELESVSYTHLTLPTILLV